MSADSARTEDQGRVERRESRETAASLVVQVSRNTLIYGAGQVLSRVAAFALLMFMARQLPVAQFGHLMILMAVLALAEIGSAAGLDRVAARDLAHDPVHGWRRLPDLTGLAGTLAAVLAAVMLAVSLAAQFTAVSAACLVLVAATAVVVTVNAVIDGALQGAQRIVPSAAGLIIASAGWLCLTVAALLLLGPSLTGVFAALLIGQSLRLALLWRAAPAQWSRLRPLPRRWRELLAEGVPYAAASILGALLLRQDMLLLGWLRGDEQAALYGAASRFVDLCLFSGMIGIVALGPALARLHGDPARLRRAYLAAVGVASAVGLATATLLHEFARPLLTLVFSETYAESAALLRILSGAIALHLAHIPAMAVLLYASSPRRMLGVAAATTGLNLLLNLALIPRMGAHGAAVAAFVSIAVGAALAAALVWRMSRLPPAADRRPATTRSGESS